MKKKPIESSRLPIEARVHRKGAHAIGNVTNVAQHPTTDGSGRTDSEIRQRAVEGAQTKPRFWWQLQRAAKEIANDIGMTHDDLKLVLALIVFIRRDAVVGRPAVV